MELTRRTFLKLSAVGVAGAALVKFGINLKPAQTYSEAPDLKLQLGKETSTICCYCAVGCGAIVTVYDDGKINIEGDPDNPINQGALCSKGSALHQLANNDKRLTKVLYRAPGASQWEEKAWDWAVDRIARNIKATRDANWLESENGVTVNRTEAIGQLGGTAHDNEECYLITKMNRALGVVYTETQARL